MGSGELSAVLFVLDSWLVTVTSREWRRASKGTLRFSRSLRSGYANEHDAYLLGAPWADGDCALF